MGNNYTAAHPAILQAGHRADGLLGQANVSCLKHSLSYNWESANPAVLQLGLNIH